MDKIINQIVAKAKKDPAVLAIAFFGSYAWKEKYNDIDICIFLFPKEYSAKELSKKKMKFIPENEKYDVHIFQQLPLYIQERILQEGKIIYCKEENALYDLYFSTQRELEHFRPMYESYLKAVAHGWEEAFVINRLTVQLR